MILLKSPEMVAMEAKNSLSAERLDAMSFDIVKSLFTDNRQGIRIRPDSYGDCGLRAMKSKR